MSRADRLALRILQLTDSLYSSLVLRRLFIKYGISCLSKLRLKHTQNEPLVGNVDGHMDDGFTLHTGCLVREGTKQIVTMWMREDVSDAEPWSDFLS